MLLPKSKASFSLNSIAETSTSLFTRNSSVVSGLLLERMLQGEIPAGRPLIQLELAQMFGCSQSCVREALQELEGVGLLGTEFNRGYHVRVITRAEAAELDTVKTALEHKALAMAIERSRRALKELNPILKKAISHVRNEDPVSFRDADRAFCEALLVAAENRPLSRIWTPVALQYYLAQARNTVLRECELRLGYLQALADGLASLSRKKAAEPRSASAEVRQPKVRSEQSEEPSISTMPTSVPREFQQPRGVTLYY